MVLTLGWSLFCQEDGGGSPREKTTFVRHYIRELGHGTDEETLGYGREFWDRVSIGWRGRYDRGRVLQTITCANSERSLIGFLQLIVTVLIIRH